MLCLLLRLPLQRQIGVVALKSRFARVACVSAEEVDYLRSEPQIWGQLCRLSMPSYAELSAVNTGSQPDKFARVASECLGVPISGV